MIVSDYIFPELFHALLAPLEQAYGDPSRFDDLLRADAFKACQHAQAFEDTHRYECSEYLRFAAEARRKQSEARILMDHCYRFRQRVGHMLWLTRELVYEYGGERAQAGHVDQLNQLVGDLESLEANLGRVHGYVEYTHYHDAEMRRQSSPPGSPPAYAPPAPAGTVGAWGSAPPAGGWGDVERQWAQSAGSAAGAPAWTQRTQWSSYSEPADDDAPVLEESEQVAAAAGSGTRAAAGSRRATRKAGGAARKRRKGKENGKA